MDVLRELQEKSKFVEWFNKKRREYYIVISKSGFTESACKYATDLKMTLFDLKNLENIFVHS